MRILMVTSSYPKYRGDSTAPFIQSIAEGIARAGHTVDLVLPEHPELHRHDREPVSLLPYRYAPRKSWSIWGYAQSLHSDVKVRSGVYLLAPLVAFSLRHRVRKALRHGRYDILHIHWVVPNAAFLLGIPTPPVVVSLHGSDVFLAEKMGAARVLARRALKAAGAITACSRDLQERAWALGAPPERTRLVRYGVDPISFAPGKGGTVRERLGIPKEALMVLGVGRLVEKKGFRVLIEAASGVPSIHLVLAGDGDLRADLETRAREAGVPVTFTGRVSRDHVAELLAASDVVAVPSLVDQAGNVDGLPNTLLEALSAGRAVVASAVAGIPEVVVDSQNGLLVPEKDAPALRQALARLSDPGLRGRLGEAARKNVLERFSWDKVATDFLDSYAQATTLDPR